MSSDLQLTLLLKRQAEDIYERNNHASFIAWREYREEIRKRIYPKQPEGNFTQESEEFDISPYRHHLSKYKDNLVQQRHMRSLKTECFSPAPQHRERNSSAHSLKYKDDIMTLVPIETLIQLEKALYNGNLDKATREYCGRLKSVANIILDKLAD